MSGKGIAPTRNHLDLIISDSIYYKKYAGLCIEALIGYEIFEDV